MRIEGVTHRYQQDSSPALHDITLTIDRGQRIAIVGASGAGKSTLAAVIAGIHHPQQGTVARPERTAVITQEVHTFAGTLRDNLTLAAPDADDADVRAALATTRASGLLELLPEGLDTMLGTTGHPLTAAQAQQIALARMVLADPDLAILDEATAEAGSSHANILDQAADAALTGRTGLVIAHRLSQAAACDRILAPWPTGRSSRTGRTPTSSPPAGCMRGCGRSGRRGASGRTGRSDRPSATRNGGAAFRG